MKSFASDNNSGVHPKILEAIIKVNSGYADAYGDDQITAKATELIKSTFGDNCKPFFVVSGTGANVLGLKAIVKSYESVLLSNVAHLITNETGSPEATIGCKLISVPTTDGKISVESLRVVLAEPKAVHHNIPKVVSITQSTESGTLYTREELISIIAYAHKHNLLVHIDGARLCNAAAALNLSLKALSKDIGVDVLSFGGTKNGLLFGEVVIFFDPELGKNFGHIRKQSLQLVSKMRFLSAQFIAYLTDNLWLENAKHSNAMAKLLAAELAALPNIKILNPVEVNSLFVRLPLNIMQKLQEEFNFYVWDQIAEPDFPKIRLMTSYASTKEEIFEFVSIIKQLL